MNWQIDTFMTKGLKLKGNELLIFALIYSFSQDEKGCYFGSISYTAEAVGCTEKSVHNAIDSLTEKHLIKCIGIHAEFKTNQYVATLPKSIKSLITPPCKNYTPPHVKISSEGVKNLHPIINRDNKIDNKSNSLSEALKKYEC